MRFLPLHHLGLRGGLAGACGGTLVAAVLLVWGGCASDSLLPDPAPIAPTASAWTLVSPLPYDIWITDLWGPSPDRMIAVGYYGRILVKDGATWREAPSPTTAHLRSVHGCDWDHVYAVSDDGLLRFDGTRWRREGPAPLDEDARVFCIAPNDAMVVTGNRESWHWDGQAWTRAGLDVVADNGARSWLTGSPDGTYFVAGDRGRYAFWHGGVWQAQTLLYSYGSVRAVAFAPGSPDRWYIADGSDSYARLSYIADNRSQIVIDRDGYRPLDLAVASTIYLACIDTAGKVVLLDDEERRMTEGPLVADAALAAFATPNGPDRVVLGGACGVLLAGSAHALVLDQSGRSHGFPPEGLRVWPDGGFVAWRWDGYLARGWSGVVTSEQTTTRYGIRDVWGPGPDRFYTLNSSSELILYVEGDDPVRLAAPRPEAYVYQLLGQGDNLWTAGWDGIERWLDGAWSPLPSPFDGAPVGWAVVRGEGEIWAGRQRELVRWVDEAWLDCAPAGMVELVHLAHDPHSDDVLAIATIGVGGIRTVWRWHDGTWTALGAPGDIPSRVCAGPGGEVWIVGHHGFHVWRDGVWHAVESPFADWEQLWIFAGDPDGGLLTVSKTGGIYHLDIGGHGFWR